MYVLNENLKTLCMCIQHLLIGYNKDIPVLQETTI